MSDNQEMPEQEINIKIALVGESNTGKTCLAVKYVTKQYRILPSTAGSSFLKSTFIDKGLKYNVLIMDSAGQEKYRSLAPLFYRNSQVVLVCFSLTDHHSFEEVNYWISQVKEKGLPDAKIYLVANKCDDLENYQVTDEEIQQLEEQQQLTCFRCSALNGQNVEQMFQEISKTLYEYEKSKNINIQSSTNENLEVKKQKKCC